MSNAIFMQVTDNGTAWPDAAIAMAGISLVVIITVAVIWLIGSTWRARMSIAREQAYQKLAEESATHQKRTADLLEQAVGELSDLRARTAEMERMLKEIE